MSNVIDITSQLKKKKINEHTRNNTGKIKLTGKGTTPELLSKFIKELLDHYVNTRTFNESCSILDRHKIEYTIIDEV